MFGHCLHSIPLFSQLSIFQITQKNSTWCPKFPDCPARMDSLEQELCWCLNLSVVPSDFVSWGHSLTWRLLHGEKKKKKPPGLCWKRGQGKFPEQLILVFLSKTGWNFGKWDTKQVKRDGILMRWSLMETLKIPEEWKVCRSFVSPGLVVLELRVGIPERNSPQNSLKPSGIHHSCRLGRGFIPFF